MDREQASARRTELKAAHPIVDESMPGPPNVRAEEAAVRARERALAKGRRTRAQNTRRDARRRERANSKLRAWTAREAAAFEAYRADPSMRRRRAWLAVWHDQPTFSEEA
jgi:hypothetical protein